MTYRDLITGSIALLLMTPALAHGQEQSRSDDRLTGRTSIGVAAVPDYEGADEHRIVPLVEGRLALGERYIAVEGTVLRANILGLDGIEFGPVANLTFGRGDDVESGAVASLGEIDDAYEVGAFAAASFTVVGHHRVRLAVQGVHDVSDVHNGFVLSASASYMAVVGDRVSVSLEAGPTWASDDYAATYFSVGPIGNAASGLTAFAARGGLKDVGVSLTAGVPVAENWNLVGYAGYRRLLGDFADSPVTALAGDADQLSAAIGISRSF